MGSATLSGTVGSPGTTPGAITVGAYVTRPSYTDSTGKTQTPFGDTDGAITQFSSQGPPRTQTLFTGLNAFKPDVTAPGEVIISQLAPKATDVTADEITADNHLTESGTSQASPIVAGMVAVLLQDNPAATAADIKKGLAAATRSDGQTGSVPNSVFGAGRVDANSFTAIVSPPPTLTAVTQPTATTLVLKGNNFALTSTVSINGTKVAAAQVTWINCHEIDVKLTTSGSASASATQNATVAVTNTKASSAGTSSLDVALALPTPSPSPSPVAAASPTAPSSGGGDSGSGGSGGSGSSGGSSGGGGGGGCFIATAAYGSYLDPHVMELRNFRDTMLMTNAPGRFLVATYYRYSPPVADFIRQHESLRLLVRVALTPIVYALLYPLVASILMLLAGAIVLRRLRRRALLNAAVTA